LIRNDVKTYINTTIPKDHTGFVHCHIKRDREGLTKGFLRTFTLYADGENENDKVFLFIKKMKKIFIQSFFKDFSFNCTKTLYNGWTF
jgi:hypothetical protein